MDIYTLMVFYEGKPAATETVSLDGAARVTETIPELLAKHPACHRIHVHAQGQRIFSVDCHGHTVPLS
jgi:hypothetical protein